MPDPNASSAEQLDALLEDGKISREEYETLRKAMDATVADEAERRRYKTPQRLRKSRKNRQLGGVCAGIAERIGVSPWRVRGVALIAFVFTQGIALIAYLCLYLLLPWDETEELDTDEKRRFHQRFALRLGGLWLANLFVCVYLGRYFSHVFEGLGQTLPYLTRWATEESTSLCGSPMGFLRQFVILGSVIGFYLILPANKPARQIFATAVYAVLLLHLCLVATAFCLAVFTMGDAAGSL
jgi:phage shock protein PspC (stress-responsive transcriptional regulator)